MKAKLAYFISRIDRRYMLIAYFAFVFFTQFIIQSPSDGGVGPT